MTKSVLGIIGGSGLYDLPGLENKRTEAVASPWGQPSSDVHLGEIGGSADCVHAAPRAGPCSFADGH